MSLRQGGVSRTVMEEVRRQKFVGPVLRGMDEEIIEALVIAIAQDNPDDELLYEDHGGYVRIHIPRRCRVTRKSLEAALGGPFDSASWNRRWRRLPDGCGWRAMRRSSGIWNGGLAMAIVRRREPAKTWSLLGEARKKPSEYEVVTARLHFHLVASLPPSNSIQTRRSMSGIAPIGKGLVSRLMIGRASGIRTS